ncbi:ParB N-terminal domain-containing protein [Microbacterium allomyrinae]|uniref:ParB N-terminal domain-containing protein n=1 Tax=Microbacterium allomyrinae TaxID=2830666 RepID=A0A9X1LRU5_9MICO|nr:ParB N-terminal domain-containing protein [Microbacterium allomyrinae]MCC2030647.1 ParB N-terminal domain-containing protein [Microbacterium allomyrinae]
MRARVAMPMPEASAPDLDAIAAPVVAAEIRYQTMPPLADDELEALERSIVAHGIQVAVLVDEQGVLIDGHHRKAIAERLGLDVPTQIRAGLTEAEKVALSISLNLDRRQLTRDQKRDIIAASLKADPSASNREHARITGASHVTVAAVRADLVATGQVDQLDKTRGADGRERTTTPTRSTVTVLNPASGELSDVPVVTTTTTRTVIDPQRAEPADVIERAISDVERVVSRTVDLSTADLPADRALEWSRRLSVSITTLRAFAHLIEGQA